MQIFRKFDFFFNEVRLKVTNSYCSAVKKKNIYICRQNFFYPTQRRSTLKSISTRKSNLWWNFSAKEPQKINFSVVHLPQEDEVCWDSEQCGPGERPPAVLRQPDPGHPGRSGQSRTRSADILYTRHRPSRPWRSGSNQVSLHIQPDPDHPGREGQGRTRSAHTSNKTQAVAVRVRCHEIIQSSLGSGLILCGGFCSMVVSYLTLFPS